MKRNHIFLVFSMAVLLILIATPVSGLENQYTVGSMTLFLIFYILAVSFNISAKSGQFSFGTSVFFGGAAYITALVGKCSVSYIACLGAPSYLSAIIAIFVLTILGAGISLATAKLRGTYFTLATFAVSQVIYGIILSLDVNIAGGGYGFFNIPFMRIGPIIFDNYLNQYYLAFGVASLATVVAFMISKSRFGISLDVIRHDVDVAETLGIGTRQFKVGVFALSSALAASAGVLYADIFNQIQPSYMFGLEPSFFPIVATYFGGAYTFLGPVIGTFTLMPLNQFVARPLLSIFAPVFYGVVLLIAMFLFPNGLLDMMNRLAKKYFKMSSTDKLDLEHKKEKLPNPIVQE